MLLLGAGASKPFGLPTMRDFTKEILQNLHDDRAEETVVDIIARLEKSGFKNPDVEAVMDVLSAREDMNRAKFSIGPKVVEFADRNVNGKFDKEAENILEAIRKIIESRCAKANFRQSDAYYRKFFVNTPGGKMLTGGEPFAIDYKHIFTTNYDLCIDSFLRKREYQYNNGFEEKSGYARVFTANWGEQTVGLGYVLCKLHGSVDWFRMEGRITQLPVVPRESLYGEEITGRMMVYPASEKYALTSPYAECLFYLRERLKTETNCVVIGYSFRDAPINSAFNDAFDVNPGIRVFSMGPHATVRVGELQEPFKSKVQPVDAEFGTDDAIRSLARAWNPDVVSTPKG